MLTHSGRNMVLEECHINVGYHRETDINYASGWHVDLGKPYAGSLP
jgi:hypothetical protein